ncbi:MAG TPA: ATP-binding cassette domain-containing protein [Pyrinomonadaceae bacterium]|nr:ATP-binding cassette domain-containing protein [Pyrinomonadaceae bacterium]
MSIVLKNLSKRFGTLVVVDRVSLDVTDSELFVLLGTSGSGKSTILRLIAGLIQPDDGRIMLHGRDVTMLPPQKRGTGFVFQNYSIFRHMSVADNIEFGLKIRRLSRLERVRKRDELLELVGMAGLGNRFADQLSGGQQQRVALARALAYEPGVLLLDEPFGALDVKTRSQLRRSLKEVQQKFSVTAILVTHDQDEAFELGDRIGVLERGRLLEIEHPEKLYAEPRTLFVATFLGAGTVLVGRTRDDQAHFGHLVLPIPQDVPHEDGTPVQVLFRPEQVSLTEEEPEDKSIVLGKGSVVEHSFTGALRRLRLRLPQLSATRQIAPVPPFGEQGILVDAVVPAERKITQSEFWVSLHGWRILQPPEPQLLVFDQGERGISTLMMAKKIAQQLDAQATLFSVTRDQDELESLRDRLNRRQQEADLAGAEVRVAIGKDPVEQLAVEQNSALYSMLLLAPQAKKRRSFARRNGRPERRRLRRISRLGTILVKVLDSAHLPVVVVKKERDAIRRILICTRGGEPGKTDVRVGGRLARRLKASVTLLYITEDSTKPGPIAHSHLERAALTLRSLDVPVETRIRTAKTPARGILAESREGDYDLIVVGRHEAESRSVFGRDDVTLQVLVGADRPVLVVPTTL